MTPRRIPAAYDGHRRDWKRLVDAVARATDDNPRVVADRLTRYVDTLVEVYGRAPEMGALLFSQKRTEMAA